MSSPFDTNDLLDFLENVIAQNDDPETGDTDLLREAEDWRATLLAPTLPIERVLVLSTAHMPSTSPSFGGLAIHQFDEGFQVYVGNPASVPEGDAPSWLKPILRACHAQGVTRLIFDCDGSRCAQLKEYDWDVETEEIE